MDSSSPCSAPIPLTSAQRVCPARFREELIASLGRLTQLARTLTPNPTDAEDLLQATCLRALERGPALRTHASISGWLARVMRNLQIDLARSPARRTTPLPSDGELAGQVPDPIPLWRQMDDQDVEELVPALSPQLRAVWQLHHGRGLDHKEIATRLRIPRATVATRVFRARAALREQLLARYDPEHEVTAGPLPPSPRVEETSSRAA
jgi:RNA polymerase sigma-70 factor, ECF subfamily